jgi:hypothetical protein
MLTTTTADIGLPNLQAATAIAKIPPLTTSIAASRRHGDAAETVGLAEVYSDRAMVSTLKHSITSPARMSW